jgi:hypothetical protein
VTLADHPVTGWTRHVTLSGVEDPPYPPIPGQPPPPDMRRLQEQHLRQQGYTSEQIEALLRPLPPLPPQYQPEPRDWAFIALCIVAALVVLCCIGVAIGVAVDTSGSPS